MNNSSILITGGTGSLGTALIPEILALSPKKLIILSRDEYKQSVLKRQYPNVRFFIGDIKDKERLLRAFHGVDYVVHAAAMKHIDICEHDSNEAIKTNIMGTKNVIDSCIDNKIKKAILVSSDKAVNPVNLYGATKLCAEKLWLSAKHYSSDVKFSVFRPGNFFDSRGSVMEIWRECMKKSIPLPVTSLDMKRYFIRLGGAAKLIIKMLELMTGNEIFVPSMQEYSVFQLLQEYAWPDKNNYKIIGLRPQEKIQEELMTKDEAEKAELIEDLWVIR